MQQYPSARENADTVAAPSGRPLRHSSFGALKSSTGSNTSSAKAARRATDLNLSGANDASKATRRSTDLAALSLEDSNSSLDAGNVTMDAAFFREVVGRTVQSFSPTESAYQLHNEYPPDKMETWNNVFPEGLHLFSGNLANGAHMKETSDMHNALNALVKRMVEHDQPLQNWCIDSIQAWYRAHYLWTSRRVQVFRSYIIPIWKARFVLPTVFVQALDILEKHQLRIATKVEQLRPEDGLAAVTRLYDTWTDYVEHSHITMMLFTDVAYVLMQSYFSFEELCKLSESTQAVQKMTANSGIAGAVVNYAGADTMRNVVMPRELGRLAAEVAWENVIVKGHRSYRAHVAIHIEAIEFNDARLLRASDDFNDEPRDEQGVLLSQDPANSMYILPESLCRPIYQPEWEIHSFQHLNENVWALANHAHRIEARLMREALQGIASRGETLPWIVDVIKLFWKEHRGWISSRFEVFQTYTLPLLEQRFRFPSAFLEAWADIMKQVQNISVLVDDLSPGDAVWHLYDLHDAWAVYDDTVTRNLRLQEPVAMILFHSYFSKAEGDKIVKEETRRMSANSRGLDAIIYHASSTISVAKSLPSTCSLELEYRRKSYEDNVATPLQSLKMGRNPKIQKAPESSTIGFARTLFSAMGAGLVKEIQ